MNILFISAWFPFPQDNGSRIRVYQLLKGLCQRHSVHLAAFLPPEQRSYLPAAQRICRQVAVVERDPFWRDPARRFTAHLSLIPRDVRRGYSPQMAVLVERAVKKQHYDLVIASTLEMAPYALEAVGSPRLLEEHNFTTRLMEERHHRQWNPLRRLAAWVTWQKCRRYERRLYPHFSALSMTSQPDLDAVRRAAPGYAGRLALVPNGVDLQTLRPGLAGPRPDTIVFNGSLTYPPNLEAMQFFILNALPLIRVRRPGVRLRITGSLQGVDLGWLPPESPVDFTGCLEDVRPVVAGSWLAVAPLRTGGGTRLKILEAMALGTPVVATPKGAEGLEVAAGLDILLAARPGALAASCLRLLQEPDLRSTIVANARRLVECRYGWEAIGKGFCSLVEALAAEKPLRVGR